MQYSIKFKSKVARMVISGSKKGLIRTQFGISLTTIDEFVNEYRKVKIREMKGIYPDKLICKKLSLKPNEFNELVSIIGKQNGRTNWITQMCKKNKAICQKV